MDQNTLTKQTEAAKDVYESGRHVLKDGLRTAKEYAETASEKSREALAKSKEAMMATQDWAKENPWMTLGIVAGIGLICGLMMGSRRR